jgi:Flp pilus assembly protein TadG
LIGTISTFGDNAPMNIKMIRAFRDDLHGNFTVIAALLAVPVITGLLIAYDHARFDMFARSVPAAIDSALVGVAQDDMMGSLSDAELDQRAKDYLLVNLSNVNEAASTVDYVRERTSKGFGAMRLHVTLVYQPLTGPLASISPAKGNSGKDWTYVQ